VQLVHEAVDELLVHGVAVEGEGHGEEALALDDVEGVGLGALVGHALAGADAEDAVYAPVAPLEDAGAGPDPRRAAGPG
jgi:hypothetical protein